MLVLVMCLFGSTFVFMMILLLFFMFSVHCESLAFKCDPIDQLQCDDGSCIDKLVWCDSSADCHDGSDEMYCNGAKPCHPEIHFECENKKCVPVSAVCDKYDDCHDGTDEKNCNGSRWLEDERNFLSDTPIVQKSNVHFASSTYFSSARLAVDEAVVYLLNMRDSNYGWGAFTPRAIIALSLASRVSPIAEKNKQLMLKQLNIQILQDLMKHENTTLSNLALYINALYATCQDPRNFQGMDLVARLRSETDIAIQLNSSIPLAFLTLCLSNKTKYTDNYVLANMYNSKEFSMQTGSRALIMQAMTCIMRKDQTGIFGEYMSNFFNYEIRKAQIADIYTQALFMQASIAAGFHYNIDLESKQLPDGSFGDMLSTYYAIPVLLNSSLLDLICNSQSKKSALESEQYRTIGSKDILYSLWITSGKDTISHSLTVKVTGKKSFFDVMTIAASRDPLYRFLYEQSDDGKWVYSIAGIPDDIESGTSWFLYTGVTDHTNVNSEQELEALYVAVDKIFPDDKDHLIFWLKRYLPTD